jgi:hypothetical protein
MLSPALHKAFVADGNSSAAGAATRKRPVREARYRCDARRTGRRVDRPSTTLAAPSCRVAWRRTPPSPALRLPERHRQRTPGDPRLLKSIQPSPMPGHRLGMLTSQAPQTACRAGSCQWHRCSASCLINRSSRTRFATEGGGTRGAALPRSSRCTNGAALRTLTRRTRFVSLREEPGIE